jgi:SAM-dependent methyltransferase
MEGILRSASGEEYPIERGVPNLVVGLDLKVQRTGEQFAFEFLNVGKMADPESKLHRDMTLLSAKTGIDPSFNRVEDFDWKLDQDARVLGYTPDYSFLEGKVVVDAGCGNGRFAKLVAPHARETILLDLGEQIHLAWEETRHLGTVHCVRCNLLNIPLASATVDFAYSIGVIHHTPAPERAAEEIGRLLCEEGRLSLWVYPPAYWGNPLKKRVTRTIRSWLSTKDLESQVSFIRRRLMPLGRFQMKLARIRPLKYLAAPLFVVTVPRHEDPVEMEATIIDYFLPEYIATYSDTDLEHMFRSLGFSYERLPFPTAGTGVKQDRHSGALTSPSR